MSTAQEKPTFAHPNGHADDSESVKQRILDAAIQLFSERGYEATPVREIVEHAGVTKPALYYYFKNKDDLFRTIVLDSMRQLTERVDQACQACGGDFLEKIRGIFRVYVDLAIAETQRVRFIHSIAFSGVYENLVDFHGLFMDMVEQVVKVFADAQRRGQLREDVLAPAMAFHFIGLAMNQVRSIVYCPEKLNEPAFQYDPIQLIWEGIAPRKTGDGGRGGLS